jgi:hypothetical protein
MRGNLWFHENEDLPGRHIFFYVSDSAYEIAYLEYDSIENLQPYCHDVTAVIGN